MVVNELVIKLKEDGKPNNTRFSLLVNCIGNIDDIGTDSDFPIKCSYSYKPNLGGRPARLEDKEDVLCGLNNV